MTKKKISRFVVLVIAATGATVPFMEEADAAQFCYLSGRQLVCVNVGEPDGGTDGDAEQALKYVPYLWKRLPWNSETVSPILGIDGCDFEGSLDHDSDPATPPIAATVYGQFWKVWMVNIETGQTVAGPQYPCQPPGGPEPGPPPDPPSPAELLTDAGDLLVLDASFWPRVKGLTGLDSKFWCSTPPSVPVGPLTVDGWTLEATASVISVTWDIAGPEELHRKGNGGCGSEASPSLTWMPNLKGDYAVTALGTWGGSYTLSYSGGSWNFTLPPVEMGTITVSGEPVPYTVDEHVGVLVN